MYYIINITKWNNFTEHYYANVYRASCFANTASIVDGTIGLNSMEKLSNTYPILYPVLKDSNERSLINKMADLIVDVNHGLPCWIVVFWNGKYSRVRTADIKNEKAIPF